MACVFGMLKRISPVFLIAVSLFLLVYGAHVAGAIAFVAALGVIALAHKPRYRKVQWSGMAVFALAGLLGLPAAAYNFSTERCIGVALDLSQGDVRSMSDPRLSAEDRRWVERTYLAVAEPWAQTGLPALRREAIANVLVAAPGYVRAVLTSDPADARAGRRDAGQALVAGLFDRRAVCHAFAPGAGRDSDIRRTARAALATVAPALKASFLPSPALGTATRTVAAAETEN